MAKMNEMQKHNMSWIEVDAKKSSIVQGPN